MRSALMPPCFEERLKDSKVKLWEQQTGEIVSSLQSSMGSYQKIVAGSQNDTESHFSRLQRFSAEVHLYGEKHSCTAEDLEGNAPAPLSEVHLHRVGQASMMTSTSKDDDSYEPIGPSGLLPPPPPPPDFPPPPLPPPPGVETKKRDELKSRTKSVGKFPLRAGDDVDLSSDHDRTGPAVSDEKLSKSADKLEKDKKPGEKPFTLDIKPYKEPTMLKVCHIVTLVLLVLSFLLMALTVVQFVDIFVWLPLLFGETA